VSGRSDESSVWLFWWDLGLLAGLIGIPAMLGFYAGVHLELSSPSGVPWRLIFAALGVLVGAVTAWRTLLLRRTRR
jgi:hypothetical protein